MKKIGLVLGVLFIILAVGCGGRIETTIAQCEEVASQIDDYRQVPQVVEGRPDFGFPNRVLSPEDLRVGELYVWCNVDTGTYAVYRLVSEPYEWPPGEEVRADVVLLRGGFEEDVGREIQIFLADHGVLPYEGGWWNPVNVLLHLLPAK